MSFSTPLSNTPLALRESFSKSALTTDVERIIEDGPVEISGSAREIVRTVQCSQCSFPLDTPVTLPCGNTLCRKCIPALFVRENITYPGTEERKQGFVCPFATCALDHAIGDCSVNVVLNKIMILVKETVIKCRDSPEAEEALLRVEEQDNWDISGVPSLREKEVVGQVLRGGKIVSTYTMAERGELAYDSEVRYTPITSIEKSNHLDAVLLEHIKEATRMEVDCQICYTLLYDPFTMTCGHTFCRGCLHQVLGHSNLCPVCRRKHAVPSALMASQAPPSLLLSELIAELCPIDLASRAEAAETDAKTDDDMRMPLFVCTLSFPDVPTFLHIFEPRYRLMIRRAIETGDRKFGMLLHNPKQEPQGQLGPAPFYQYGTLLHIISMHLMPDGRSLIETVGVSRFRVLKYGKLDGYTVGQIERIDDITLSAEETIEARETAPNSPNPQLTRTRSANVFDHFGAPSPRSSHTIPHVNPKISSKFGDLSSLSTHALYALNVAYVKKMQTKSAPWLHRNIIIAYGEIPTDMALFPWWFASVVPIDDGEKYRLLGTASVRERLKITAGWVIALEGRTWYV